MPGVKARHGAGGPDVTVTVVLHNSAGSLPACLRSITPAVDTGAVDVVVVDNASPDNSRQLVQTLLPQATLVSSARNLGFAAGCNLAWPRVRGRYWLLLNPDVVVPAGGVEAMARWMDRQPDVGVTSPRIVDGQGTVQAAARRFPSIALSLLELSRLHLFLGRGRRGRVLLGTYAPDGKDLDADWVPGTAMFLRREAVETVGNLSEKYFMYGEDVELCWRMRRGGWRVAVPANVTFCHEGRVSAERTWGATEARGRSLAGWYRACAEMNGHSYARWLLRVDWAAAMTESRLPWRSIGHRESAGEAARLVRSLLATSARSMPPES